jgi:hypothetical protein
MTILPLEPEPELGLELPLLLPLLLLLELESGPNDRRGFTAKIGSNEGVSSR